jgi:hypothetical protein
MIIPYGTLFEIEKIYAQLAILEGSMAKGYALKKVL